MIRRYNSNNSAELKDYYEGYMSESPCAACDRARLNPQALAVTYNGKSIHELTTLNISKAKDFLHDGLDTLSPQDFEVANRISTELDARLQIPY